MTLSISHLLDLKTWLAARSFLRAMWAHGKGDYQKALVEFGKAVRVDRVATSEHMAFYAILLSLNRRPAEEALAIYRLVSTRRFRGDTAGAQYAEAYAEYMVAFLTSRADVEERWLDARNLKPDRGFASRELPLPPEPLVGMT